jgi:hypothetical protein
MRHNIYLVHFSLSSPICSPYDQTFWSPGSEDLSSGAPGISSSSVRSAKFLGTLLGLVCDGRRSEPMVRPESVLLRLFGFGALLDGR